jgi:hypothetical protein
MLFYTVRELVFTLSTWWQDAYEPICFGCSMLLQQPLIRQIRQRLGTMCTHLTRIVFNFVFSFTELDMRKFVQTMNKTSFLLCNKVLTQIRVTVDVILYASKWMAWLLILRVRISHVPILGDSTDSKVSNVKRVIIVSNSSWRFCVPLFTMWYKLSLSRHKKPGSSAPI